jgi:hypothetical protein
MGIWRPQLLHCTADNLINFVILVRGPFKHRDTDRLLPKASAVVRAPYAGCT